MDEIELKKLKLKCNKLIDEALRLEGELKEKDKEIERLQEKKRALEKRQKQTVSNVIPVDVNPSPPEQEPESLEIISERTEAIKVEEKLEAPEYQESIQEFMNLMPSEPQYPKAITSVRPEKIFEMIQTLSAQLDERPREEIVVRKLTFSAKLLEVFSDITGKIFKFIILGIIMALLSVGATILLNAQTRDMLFEFIKNCIGGGL